MPEPLEVTDTERSNTRSLRRDIVRSIGRLNPRRLFQRR